MPGPMAGHLQHFGEAVSGKKPHHGRDPPPLKNFITSTVITTIPLLALLALIGCGGGAASSSQPPITDLRSESAVSGERQPVRVALDTETINRLNRMAFWINALVPEETDAEIVWEAHGHSLTRGEYERSLREFLDGREPNGDLLAEYHRELETQVQLIRYLEMGHLNDSERLLDRARPALRERMAELVLETLLDDWEPSQSEIQALYDQRRDEFAQPERVRVRIVLLEGLDEAEEVLLLLEEGADFRRLAQERSIHESRSEGGELEEFRRGTFNEEFEEAAFSLEPGELALVTTGAGTFVMEKISHVAASYTPLDQVRPMLVEELQTRRREAILDQVRQRTTTSH